MKVVPAELNILLVEDDDIDARTFKRVLQRSDIEGNLYHAGDGVEALELLHSGDLPEPVLIVTDINMPRMDGITMIDAIRSDTQLREKAIFVLSTSSDQKDKSQAFQLNVAGYVEKTNVPETLSDFLELLRDYVNIVEIP